MHHTLIVVLRLVSTLGLVKVVEGAGRYAIVHNFYVIVTICSAVLVNES